LLVGLLAARVAGSAQRVLDGVNLDQHDFKILLQAQEMIFNASAALQFAATGGQDGERPANFSAVELTIEVAERVAPPANLKTVLSELAQHLETLENEQSMSAARIVCEFFNTVSNYASRDVGSVGENPATL